jgi:DNA repair protein RadC
VHLNVSEPPPTEIVSSTLHATTILHRLFATLEPDQEHFLILSLNTKLGFLRYKVISSGGQSDTIIDPKLVFRHALLLGASHIILSHSHPSGTPTPSAEDHRVTQELVHVGLALNLPVLDHIIIAPPNRSYSFAQSGCMPT